MGLRSFLNPILEPFGYQLFRSSVGSPGLSPFRDMRRLNASARPTIFDVGANRGQTIRELRRFFGEATIHAFEPSTRAFDELRRKCAHLPNVRLNNVGVGSRVAEREFNEPETTEMSSFLTPGSLPWNRGIRRYPVRLTTVDQYCADNGVQSIDVLKSDTQGYDLEVLNGANRMLQQRRVHMIYLELIFAERRPCKMYQGLPRFDHVYGFLTDRGYALVAFYRFYYEDNRVSVSDALFVQPDFEPDHAEAVPQAAGSGVSSTRRHVG
jgi:FkbM family methyltransferase